VPGRAGVHPVVGCVNTAEFAGQVLLTQTRELASAPGPARESVARLRRRDR